MITDQISDKPMAVKDGAQGWVGIVRRVDDKTLEVETVAGNVRFPLNGVELVALDSPKPDESPDEAPPRAA